jgi:hypothetical protein
MPSPVHAKNDSQFISHFALLGSTIVKAVRKHVGKINPWTLVSISPTCLLVAFTRKDPNLLTKTAR